LPGRVYVNPGLPVLWPYFYQERGDAYGEAKTRRISMKFAIVESGGKQYRAVEGGTIEVDRLQITPGESIDIEQVLMLVDGDDVAVGTPTVKGAAVKATVLEHFKGEKTINFHYKPKKRIRQKTGHRQQYTRLEIEKIG
jgi:large subunit ribosomal protein L21